ncbi:hypothetical protein KIN20_034755 [Parelaphostrongylus tenuis]|uniref:Cytochrome b5 heme-binding domain-containing protein n=1 Tax=Parelaphostrongylus tenuis TaxID=148309 RepID=A0AAD5RD41_PARTN|nr:hypothetical protein KIN20_034755 [Parelaphostrongylus tenuis]
MMPGRQTLSANPVGRSEYGRVKVELSRGRSLMDWIRLASGKILAKKRMSVDHVELVRHNNREDCWIHISGQVYDVTSYLEFHPGGIPELMRAAGTDATGLFNHYHPWVNYQNMLKSCLVGGFTGDLSMLPQPGPSTASNVEVDLIENRFFGHQRKAYWRRLWDDKTWCCRREIGIYSTCFWKDVLVDLCQSEKHFRIVVRPRGHSGIEVKWSNVALDQLSMAYKVAVKDGSISVIFQSAPKSFLSSASQSIRQLTLMGICTPCLDKLGVGDSIEISDPIGNVDLSTWTNPEYDLLLLAAGTGITPMVNVLNSRLQKIEKNPSVSCNTCLMLFNRTEQDIVSDDWLPMRWNDNRVKVEHILSSPSESWSGRIGHISADMIPPLNTSLRVVSVWS